MTYDLNDAFRDGKRIDFFGDAATPMNLPSKTNGQRHAEVALVPPPGRFDDEQAGEPDIELPTLGSVLDDAIKRVDRRREGLEKPIPVIGADYAEALGGGRWPGAHVVVSGTGAGKSQFEIQNQLIAAKAGIPTLYIGLELSALQIATRTMGEESRLPWSDLYIGNVSPEQIERANAAIPSLRGLPFYLDFGMPKGWPISRLELLLIAMRKKYPQGELSVVVDYLQLIAGEISTFGADQLRKQIGDIAYQIHALAMRYDAAVAVVSSSARNNYAALAGDIADAGFDVVRVDGKFKPEKRIASPERFVGMSKESGETEFAAESVTALVKWPGRLPTGETIVLAVCAKVRCRWPRWAAYTFQHGRFSPYPVETMADLPDLRPRHGGRESVGDDDLLARIVDNVRAGTLDDQGKPCPWASKTAVLENTSGNQAKLRKAFDACMGSLIHQTKRGIEVVDDE